MHPQLSPWRPILVLAAFTAACVLATTTVTVAPGDTLSVLAAQHGVTVDELVAWNDLDDADLIVAGSTLVVAAPARPSSTPAGGVYVVTAGDTLGAIAARFGSTVARLAAANGVVDPDRIIEGQRLQVGEGGQGSAPATTPDTTPAEPATTHVVVSGDTLSELAEHYGLPLRELMAANGLDDPDRVRIGRTLRIPAPSTPATTPEPASAPSTDPDPAPTAPEPASAVTPAPVGSSRAAVLVVPLFNRWATTYGVPQDLLEAIAWHASDWRPDAVGADGRAGMMQLTPATVEMIEGGLIGRDLDPFDPADAVQMGARYLRFLLDRTGSEREAVAAWAQGLTGVRDHGISAGGAAFADAVEQIRRERA